MEKKMSIKLHGTSINVSMFWVQQGLRGPEMASLIIENGNRQELTALATIPMGTINLRPIAPDHLLNSFVFRHK
jgi:hypothetical protein